MTDELDQQLRISQHMSMPLRLRHATSQDAEVIYKFIVDLALYEREPDAVKTSPDVLRRQLRDEHPPFRCVIAEVDNEPCGFALYFHNYSTWRGSAGIYLEDLFVDPTYRGQGIGQALLKFLAKATVSTGGHRLEWSVLDWNESAIQFYRQLGAYPMNEWTTWRLTDSELADLAGNE